MLFRWQSSLGWVLLIRSCLAWGQLGLVLPWFVKDLTSGHEIVARIAQRQLTEKSENEVEAILPAFTGGELAAIASWADRIKHLPQYRFTSQLHYVNGDEDDDDYPPFRCLNVETWDEEDNIIGAIQNYTDRLVNSEMKSWKKQEALRFLTHFWGDVHQPLHLTGRYRGGNDQKVVFDNRLMSFHQLWDSALLEKRAEEVHKQQFPDSWPGYVDIDYYVNYIVNLTDSNVFQDQIMWLACFETDSDLPNYGCPGQWAAATSRLNCEFIWDPLKQQREEYSSIPIDWGYYEKIRDELVLEYLLAQAGTRLAATLNSCFDPREQIP